MFFNPRRFSSELTEIILSDSSFKTEGLLICLLVVRYQYGDDISDNYLGDFGYSGQN